jgi:hypothetical protein
MTRGLQLAQQIVVLERRRREKDGVNREPDERKPAAVEIRESTSGTGPLKPGHYLYKSG